tara:strand:- start:313 stop:621 length:309 start_codon:yes stop_codon:yes gene_type:complete
MSKMKITIDSDRVNVYEIIDGAVDKVYMPVEISKKDYDRYHKVFEEFNKVQEELYKLENTTIYTEEYNNYIKYKKNIDTDKYFKDFSFHKFLHLQEKGIIKP